MNRKSFLHHFTGGCLCGCATLAALKTLLAGDQPSPDRLGADLSRRVVAGARAPDWRRAEKSLSWIRNMLEQMDQQLDEATRNQLLNACGRACFIFAQGVADEPKLSPEAAEGFFGHLKKAGFPVECRPDCRVIEFGYQGEQNPQGLSLKEGYCMCPIVETESPGLSPSFCNCSAGYVKELVERNTGMTVRKVEVLESIKRGNRDCRFRLELIPG